MAETVQLKIATVGTQEAAKQTKTLRQQIKELREELATLDTTTEEYNAKLTELGNAMHAQQEITEQARMATEDYGATLGNLSSIASGVVGSIAAVNGVMNMLGVNSKGAEETIKAMTSLIGIMQGLNQLEDAEKNFDKLWGKVKNFARATKESTEETKNSTTSIKANSMAAKEDAVSMGQAATATKAQGVAAATTTKATNLLSVGFRKLRLAIKSFMASNPFTLILLAITSIYTIVSNIIDKQREATEEMRRQKEELRKMNDAVVLGEKGQSSYTQEQMQLGGMILSAQHQGAGNNKRMDPTVQSNIDSFNFLRASQKETLQAMENENKKYTEEYANQYRKFINDLKEENQFFINWYENEISRIQSLTVDDFSGTKGDRERNLKKQQETMKGYEEALKSYYTNLYEIYLAGQEYEKELAKDELAVIKDKNELEKRLAENAHNKMETTDEQYYSRLADIENEYFESYQKWAKKCKVAQKDVELATADHASVLIGLEKELAKDELAVIKDKNELEKRLAENAHNKMETTDEQYYSRLVDIENEYFESYQKWAKKHKVAQKDVELATADHASVLIGLEKDLATELLRIRAWQTDPSRGIALSRAERERDDAVAYHNQVRSDNERVMIAEQQARQQRLEFEAAWFVEKLDMLDKYNREASKREREAAIESLRIQQERKGREIAAIGANYDQNRSDENAQYEHDLQELRKQYEKKVITQQQYEQKSEELTNEHLIRLRGLETDYVNDLAQAEADLSDTRLQIQQEEFEMEKELFEQRKEMIATYVSAFSTITSSVTSLLSEVQGRFDEGTKEYERIAEAMLIMQTIEGSMAAFVSGVESGLPAPYNFAFGTLLAGLATATGIMSIKNLKSKKLSNSASTATVSNPYQTFVYETGSNIEGNIRDSRCYVVETDITETQDRVSVIQDEASF